MKVSDMFPSKYLKGSDLGGKAWTFEIAMLKFEEMHNKQTNSKVKKPVLYFKGPRKGLILNRTIAEQVAQATGHDESDNWPGKHITVYPTNVTAFGATHLVVRVRKSDNGPSQIPDDLSHDESEIEEFFEDDEDLAPTSEPESPPPDPRPYSPQEIKKRLEGYIQSAGEAKVKAFIDPATGDWLPGKLHSFGDRAPNLVAAKWQEALGDQTDPAGAYHVSLEWLTGKTSATDLLAVEIGGLFRVLFNGSEPGFETPVSEMGKRELVEVYASAMKDVTDDEIPF